MKIVFLAIIAVSALLVFCIPRSQAQDLQQKADDHHANSQESSEGIVLGKLTGEHMDFAAAGLTGKGGKKPDQSTLFEIGSITKVFTAILLAETVREEKAAFDDPVTKFLPESLSIDDESPLHTITLQSLASHTSGLPRLPSNLEDGVDPTNPYAHYDEKMLYAYLKVLTKGDLAPSDKPSYSNLGFGLLGHLLELIWEKPYPTLADELIFQPLGMTATLVPTKFDELPPEAKAKLATGHVAGKTVPHWELGVFLGAGAILSSAEDLLKFAQAYWNTKTPEGLAASLREVAKERTTGQGLAWFIRKGELMHDGGTGGFRSSLLIDPKKKIASVRLTNSAGESHAQESSGDFSAISGFWEGTLDAGVAKLRQVAYITGDGRVTLFSLDQGFASMEATKTSIEKNEFRFAFPSVEGSYEGKPEGKNKLVGIWKQGGELPLTMTRSEKIPEALRKGLAEKVEGDITELVGFWSGYLGGKSGLFVYVRIAKIGDAFNVTLHTPDQHPAPLFVGKITKKGEDFSFTCPPVKGKFQGKMSRDGKTITGKWNQGQDMPLELKWSKEKPTRE